MTWWVWVLIALGAYFAIGALIATILMQTPYSENGWLQIMLLWPLYVLAITGVLR